MLGSVLAATDESPGEKIIHEGRHYVVYRGMGSLAAMVSGKGSRERYGQSDVDDSKKLVPQGVEGMVPYRGSLWEVVYQFSGILYSDYGQRAFLGMTVVSALGMCALLLLARQYAWAGAMIVIAVSLWRGGMKRFQAYGG